MPSALDNIVKYWLLILTGVSMIAAVAIAGDRIEHNSDILKNHERRIEKLEKIEKDINHLVRNQDKILDLLLNKED
jgi:hypothetical protein